MSAVDQIKAIITSVATSLGVDPRLALAIAQQESGFNPNAIGDSGHSVGLFQLNDRGEGAGMTVAQREDPTVNARIALTQVANVARSSPNLSPGEIAAAAQRPADRVGYAASINRILGSPSASSSAVAPSSSTGRTTDIGLPSPGDVVGAAGSFLDQFNPFALGQDFATSVGKDIIQGLFRIAVYGTLLAAGGALVVLGGWRAVSQTGAYRSLEQAKETATTAGVSAAAMA